MKILIDARLYGLEHAGLGRYTINLVGELAKLDKTNEYVLLLRQKYFQAKQDPALRDNQLNLPIRWKKVLADFRHYSLAEQALLPKIISKEKPDLVHFLHMNVPVFYQGKFVVTVHDLLMQKHRGAAATTLPFYAYFPKVLMAKYVVRFAVDKALKIIVPSAAVKREVVSHYRLEESKVIVTYEGVDGHIASVDSSKKILLKYKLRDPYFIYTGNAYPHKNLERAIKAVVFLNKKKAKNVSFAIVSSRGIFTQRLEKIITNLKAQKYIRLLGFVPDKELEVLYKNSLGFFYPSLSEGFGLPGLEAMAAGSLVVCSDIPVFREVYKDVPIYFDPFDVASLEKSLEKVLSLNPKDRLRIIEKGQKLAKNYSWRKMASETLKVYESV